MFTSALPNDSSGIRVFESSTHSSTFGMAGSSLGRRKRSVRRDGDDRVGGNSRGGVGCDNADEDDDGDGMVMGESASTVTECLLPIDLASSQDGESNSIVAAIEGSCGGGSMSSVSGDSC